MLSTYRRSNGAVHFHAWRDFLQAHLSWSMLDLVNEGCGLSEGWIGATIDFNTREISNIVLPTWKIMKKKRGSWTLIRWHHDMQASWTKVKKGRKGATKILPVGLWGIHSIRLSAWFFRPWTQFRNIIDGSQTVTRTSSLCVVPALGDISRTHSISATRYLYT